MEGVAGRAYGESVQTKTWEKPKDRTRERASSREGMFLAAISAVDGRWIPTLAEDLARGQTFLTAIRLAPRR